MKLKPAALYFSIFCFVSPLAFSMEGAVDAPVSELAEVSEALTKLPVCAQKIILGHVAFWLNYEDVRALANAARISKRLSHLKSPKAFFELVLLSAVKRSPDEIIAYRKAILGAICMRPKDLVSEQSLPTFLESVRDVRTEQIGWFLVECVNNNHVNVALKIIDVRQDVSTFDVSGACGAALGGGHFITAYHLIRSDGNLTKFWIGLTAFLSAGQAGKFLGFF